MNIDNQTIVDLFLRQVVSNPNQIAIQFEGNTLSYKQLDEESNKFANYIRSVHAIEKEDIIGICLDRSEFYVVVLLAIFKLNCCASSIDVKTPEERLRSIQNDFKFIIDKKLVDTYLSATTQFSTQIPYKSDGKLAYIVYTSGSTGAPKGCMLEHKGIINHLQSKIALLRLNSESKICHTSKFYFVGAIWQLWAPLVAGGTVVLTTLEELQDISQLLDKTIANDIKILEVIPSQLNNVFATGNHDKLTHLETLILTGERLTASYVNSFFDLNPNIKIINTYGQSECSDVTAYFEIKEKIKDDKILIGKPVKNSEAYICDANGNRCAPGEIGELCISGTPVGRGYLNNPELTAEKFIENPFEANTKLYKTGDLCRQVADGNLEILGRIDNQVKIRGYRIDLGEIENALLKHNEIENVVAIAATNKDSEEKVIAAYIIAKSTQETQKLREFLADFLPDYMIPAIFVQVSDFELTANGKINKKVLPDPFKNKLKSGVNYVAPTNEIEKQVIEIWVKTLKQETIGMADDFIALGGHSLKMNLLIIRYKKAFNVAFNLGELFDNTSLKSHVELIKSKEEIIVNAIPSLPESETYELSDAQQKLLLLSKIEGDLIQYDTIFFEEIERITNIELFQKAVAAVIQRHEIIRTVFKKNSDGKLSQKILPGTSSEFSLKVHDLRQSKKAMLEMSIYSQNFGQRPFDLENGPLVFSYLFILPNEEYRLYIRMHQAISDANSLNIVYKDILTTYKAYCDNLEPNLPELSIQYKEYASWHKKQRYHKEFEKSNLFWKNQLSGQLPVLNLPNSKERPLVKTYNGKLVQFRINQELSNSLNAFCKENNGTAFNGILTLLNILFQKYTSQKEIIIATRSHGRYRSEFQHQIGNYLNTIVLKNTIDDTQSFSTIFQEIKTNTLACFDHQNYYFDWLIEDLHIKTTSNRNPVYDIMMTFEDKTHESIDSDEKVVIDEVTDEGISTPKLDMLFTIELYTEFLQIELQYNTDIYTKESMVKLLEDFKKLMSELLQRPTAKISTIDFNEQTKKALKSKNLSRLKTFKM